MCLFRPHKGSNVRHLPVVVILLLCCLCDFVLSRQRGRQTGIHTHTRTHLVCIFAITIIAFFAEHFLLGTQIVWRTQVFIALSSNAQRRETGILDNKPIKHNRANKATTTTQPQHKNKQQDVKHNNSAYVCFWVNLRSFLRALFIGTVLLCCVVWCVVGV